MGRYVSLADRCVYSDVGNVPFEPKLTDWQPFWLTWVTPFCFIYFMLSWSDQWHFIGPALQTYTFCKHHPFTWPTGLGEKANCWWWLKQKFQVFLNKMRPDLILGPWRRDISNTQWQSVLYILNLFTVPLNKEGLLAILYQVYMLFQSCIEESSKMIIYKKTSYFYFPWATSLKRK